MKKVLRIVVLGALAVGIGIQFVPVQGVASNPPDRFPLGAPPEVEAIMRRACLDCHSNETRWPLYSRIAPGSWLMARDVRNGRQHLNLSEWGESDEDERKIDRENCWEQIESGAMPPWFYVYPLHLSARLSAADKEKLKSWLMKESEGGGSDKTESKEVADADGGANNAGADGGAGPSLENTEGAGAGAPENDKAAKTEDKTEAPSTGSKQGAESEKKLGRKGTGKATGKTKTGRAH